jgi:hypothetical protein
MYYFRLISTMSLCAAVSDCSTEPIFCPDRRVFLTSAFGSCR